MSPTIKFLQSQTSDAWVEQAINNLDILLLDHSHCERKAAGVALSFIARYPSNTDLIYELTAIAQEELSHFALVNQCLAQRGVALQPLPPSPYGAALKAEVRSHEPQRLLDALLIAALIEARSHERLGLLADHCPDPDLSRLYRSLMASEARHYGVYWRLARLYYPAAEVNQRLDELARQEAQLVATLHSEPRMHS